MKWFFPIVFITFSFFCFSQTPEPLTELYYHEQKVFFDKLNTTLRFEDASFDVKFYHLDVEVGIDEPYISGKVGYLVEVLNDNLNSLILDLDDKLLVDSVTAVASGFSFSDNQLEIFFENNYDAGSLLEFEVHYHGVPELAGGYKGLRYEFHDDDEPVIATLSTPYLAHYWWPCKDGPSDKADSVFVDITIPDIAVSGLPLVAVSNGLLEGVESFDQKKKFKWRHRYPIVPYYVMLAISNYQHIQDEFVSEEGTLPLDYYVFESHYEEALEGMAPMPEVIAFFSDLYGPYPFLKEKYGMTQLGYYGAIENQTNTIQNNLGLGWLYVSVHELAHQWFGDMITCADWHHGWLNEGFATYSEALWEEHSAGFEAYQNYMEGKEFFDEGKVYLEDVSDPYSGVFRSIIYNKGAWVLHMLRGVVGDEDFFEILHSYALDEDFRYKNSTTEDFQAICESVSGEDLDYFFDQWIYDERYPVYHYNFQQSEDAKVHISIEQVQASESGWREVFQMPLDIRINFEFGIDTTVHVNNEQVFQAYNFDSLPVVESIEIDPDNWILKEAFFDPQLPVGLNEICDAKISIVPNPNRGSFWIEMPLDSRAFEMKIYNASGQFVRKVKEENYSGSPVFLDLSDLNKGLYLMEISDGKGRCVKKVVVE